MGARRCLLHKISGNVSCGPVRRCHAQQKAVLGCRAGAHKSRQTQSVVDREGLTTTDEKLSKVSGPI